MLKPVSIDEKYWKEYLKFVNIKSIHEPAPLHQVFSLIKLVRFSEFKNVLISGLEEFMLKPPYITLYSQWFEKKSSISEIVFKKH